VNAAQCVMVMLFWGGECRNGVPCAGEARGHGLGLEMGMEET
jgi:hypothetical protein